MKSIDKLREFVDDQFVSSGQAYLQGMAIANSIEVEIAANYLELPKDADGVPIHVGDKIQFRNDSPITVDSIGTSRVYESDWGFFGSNGGFYGQGTMKNVHHVKPDTLKGLLSELANEVWEASCTCQTTWSDSGLDGIEERYADKIRELLNFNKKTIYDWLYFAFALEHNDLFFEFIDKLSSDKSDKKKAADEIRELFGGDVE